MKGLIGKKLGMTRVFDDSGNSIVVTVIEVGPCTVLQTRTTERNGYSAIQLGFGKRQARNVMMPVRGQLAAAGCQANPPELIREVRIDQDPEYSAGDVLGADLFVEDEFVDVTGITRGLGFQGVVKRWNFAGGRASHGGAWVRRPGSIGMCEKPGKVYKNRKMPGHTGNVRRTVQNLRVVRVLADDNCLLIRGAVPGPNGRHVMVKESIKKKKEAAKK